MLRGMYKAGWGIDTWLLGWKICWREGLEFSKGWHKSSLAGRSVLKNLQLPFLSLVPQGTLRFVSIVKHTWKRALFSSRVLRLLAGPDLAFVRASVSGHQVLPDAAGSVPVDDMLSGDCHLPCATLLAYHRQTTSGLQGRSGSYEHLPCH